MLYARFMRRDHNAPRAFMRRQGIGSISNHPRCISMSFDPLLGAITLAAVLFYLLAVLAQPERF